MTKLTPAGERAREISAERSKEKAVDRMYATAKSAGIFAIGGERAFQIVGPAIRQAFVSQAILQQVNNQDDSIPAETVRSAMVAMYDRLTSDQDFQS